MGEDTISGQRVAVKLFKSGERGTLLFENENRIQSGLPRHPTLLKYLGRGKLNHKYFIALELFPHPSLASFMATHGPLGEGRAVTILRQIVRSSCISLIF